ncbi:synaptonemal complex protein 3-like [Dendronephthya gigantea]|uniref:synaptonemal complex protein 3-like n=1 Tax=Dendronephthya gigantea TaxID=151771 RepID=UPI001069D783|nr:synaptonemal complex protein 3-like [Dendronephthya gigantea]
MANKEKNVHKFTTGALKTTDKKVGEIWKKQRLDRSKLLEEFSNSINSVTHQCDADVVTINEKEKEWEKGFQEILNGVHQHRIIQTQRIKTLIQITNTLMKSFEDLENCHCEQQSNVQGELKKDMSQLQKKIMKETQQQELSNVRKSLQTMLAHV